MPISEDLVIAYLKNEPNAKFLCRRIDDKLEIIFTYSFHNFDHLYFEGLIVSNKYYNIRKATKEEISEYLMRKL